MTRANVKGKRTQADPRARAPLSVFLPVTILLCSFLPPVAARPCRSRFANHGHPDYQVIPVLIEPPGIIVTRRLSRGNCFILYRSFNSRALNPLAMPLVYQLRGICWATVALVALVLSRPSIQPLTRGCNSSRQCTNFPLARLRAVRARRVRISNIRLH